MLEPQKIYIILNENNMQQFFPCLRTLVFFGKRNVQIHISEGAIKVLRKLAKKKSKIGEESKIRTMTFRLDNEFIDIIYDDKNDIIEIAFGPLSEKEKRSVFIPYKRKNSIKIFVRLETE